jgi:hypothetical protein
MRTIVFTTQAITRAAEQAPEGLTVTGIRDTTDYADLVRRALATGRPSAWNRNNYPGTD